MATPPPTEPVDGATSQTTTSTAYKPIHSLVLDTGPLIKNDPPVSALVSRAEVLYTIPSVISEIRDPATRTRVETTLLPFVTVRAPGPASIKFVTDFARRTGDLAVLSRPDIEVLALGYELELERNNGDWRLRNTPVQKTLNGRVAGGEERKSTDGGTPPANEKEEEQIHEAREQTATVFAEVDPSCETPASLDKTMGDLSLGAADLGETPTIAASAEGESSAHVAQEAEPIENAAAAANMATSDPAVDDDSDEDGWITPSNLKKHQAQDSHTNTPSRPMQKTLQAAILTSDYAMQNVALRINLNLVTPSFSRITHLKNWLLRCHGCFSITRDTEKQFCPKCGQPTLTRTSCSTDSHGNFQIHLKKNFQWNKRGNVYSVPKAVHGSANGRPPKGQGGKNGWGRELILAEDQKEFIKAADEQRRQRKKDLMDDDYLPAMLTGKRTGQAGKIRVGAGKNVNSKRKH
ncbi:hypothetical protein EsDP_00006290 [Epichloe bromicola]|uniref:20S-pre-rRNA D-site endonuclease NOB1 n=1 Tax=Epichloe bromicola TaxID=79588 RepID=A0ABQ0CX67_9HYPO